MTNSVFSGSSENDISDPSVLNKRNLILDGLEIGSIAFAGESQGEIAGARITAREQIGDSPKRRSEAGFHLGPELPGCHGAHECRDGDMAPIPTAPGEQSRGITPRDSCEEAGRGQSGQTVLIFRGALYNRKFNMENNKVILASSGLILVFLVGLILRLAKPVFFPFFLAVFFYFILSPALDLLLRLKIPKAIAVGLIIVSTFVVLYLLGALFYSSGKNFAAALPGYAQEIGTVVRSVGERLHLAKANWDPWLWSKSLDGSKVASFFIRSLDQIFAFFSNFILILVFLMFMLAGRGKLKNKVDRSFSHHRALKINQVWDNIDKQVQRYLIIKTAISLISGLITLAVLLIFGVKYALVFAFLTFILNFIPSLGSIAAIAFSSINAAFQFGSVARGLWVLLILMVLDVLVANLLEPKMFGRGLGLSPLVVLFSLFFWGWLWGIPGMILAVPLMAIIKIVCGNVPSLQFIAEFMSA
jgi:predicted PurR-regulated permease PerM